MSHSDTSDEKRRLGHKISLLIVGSRLRPHDRAFQRTTIPQQRLAPLTVQNVIIHRPDDIDREIAYGRCL